jgi:hypothetical protein
MASNDKTSLNQAIQIFDNLGQTEGRTDGRKARYKINPFFIN